MDQRVSAIEEVASLLTGVLELPLRAFGGSMIGSESVSLVSLPVVTAGHEDEVNQHAR
jgi:hypothetical protein